MTTPSKKSACLRGLTFWACMSLSLLAACDSSDTLGKHARGNWQGIATQTLPDGKTLTYPMTIVITDDEHIATDYPSFGCESTLVRLPSSDGHAEFREEIPDSTECLNGGLVTLVASPEDHTTLSWRWKMRTEKDELIYATATMKRIPPVEPKSLEYYRTLAR